MPSAAYTDASSGASGSGSSAATYAGEPVARSSAVPKRSGSAATSSIGTPSTVTPTARARGSATICGSSANRSSRRRRRAHDGEPLGRVAPAPRRRRPTSPSSAAAIPPASSRARPSTRPRAARGAALAASASSSCASIFGPMPGTSAAGPPPRPRAAPRRRDAERPRDLDRPLRAPEAEVAAEADDARRQLALELGQLGDSPVSTSSRSRASMPGRSRAARAPARSHQLVDRHRRAADRLGRPAVRARRVRVRVRQLEQRRERVEAVGDPGVVHQWTVGRAGSLPGVGDGPDIALVLHPRRDPGPGARRDRQRGRSRTAAGC